MLLDGLHKAPLRTSGRSLPHSHAPPSSLKSSSFRPCLGGAQSIASRIVALWIKLTKEGVSSEAMEPDLDLKDLSDADRVTVGEALRAAADGPFFPDWEFHPLFGLERSRVRAIANGWPEPNAPPEQVTIAVVNSLNNLVGYLHGEDAVWSQWMSADRQQLLELLSRLSGRTGNSSTNTLPLRGDRIMELRQTRSVRVDTKALKA